MNIIVKKLTDISLLREMAEMTTGKESKMSLATAYKNQHSLIRTQMWAVKMYGIPTFVANHLVRHVHAQPFVKSNRLDRGGEDFQWVCDTLADDLAYKHSFGTTDSFVESVKKLRYFPQRFDRNKPVDMALLLNSEEIINISKARLCYKASKETREIWQQVLYMIEEIDPDLVRVCQKPCVMTGVCKESTCGYMNTTDYAMHRKAYKELF